MHPMFPIEYELKQYRKQMKREAKAQTYPPTPSIYDLPESTEFSPTLPVQSHIISAHGSLSPIEEELMMTPHAEPAGL